MNIYTTQALQKISFFNKLFHKKPKRNCIIEINNLFASKNIDDISIEDILNITNSYHLNFKTLFQKELKELYKTYLIFCLNDRILSDSEIDRLKHIKEILFLSDKDVDELNNEVTSNIYKDEVKNVIADGLITDEEREFLTKLQAELKLPEEIADNIYKTDAAELYKNAVLKVLAENSLSPEEDEELRLLAKNLRIEVNLDNATQNVLNKHRLYWQIMNGNLPVVTVGINLQKSETCHFNTHIDWLETRRVTQRITYSGPTMRIKIAKGLYWRAGNLAVKPISRDVLTTIDSGDLYLTNKRIIFMGNLGNKTIALNKILNFEVYSNGVEIQKDTGKSPFFSFSSNADIFGLLLGRIIGNS